MTQDTLRLTSFRAQETLGKHLAAMAFKLFTRANHALDLNGSVVTHF